MERTGYESLGTLTALDGRVEHLRETIQWAAEHLSMAAYDTGVFLEHLEMALALDEAHEMNRKYDAAKELDAELQEVARRKVAALDALGEMGII